MDFGWKKKAERLRMVILSAAHQPARELPPTLVKCLGLFRELAKTGDMAAVKTAWRDPEPDEKRPLFEPLEVYGWNIQATLYVDNGQLWWLLHAVRRNEQSPSAKDLAILNKVLEHLGADPTRDAIIGPGSCRLEDEGSLPFGWWTWFNRMDLFEIQVKGQGRKAVSRTVPLGTPEVDGFVRVDLSKGPS